MSLTAEAKVSAECPLRVERVNKSGTHQKARVVTATSTYWESVCLPVLQAR